MTNNNIMNKPFSQACENNKNAILSILKKELSHAKHTLEIGSGSGQHAVYFAKNLPQLQWQTSDLAINHQGINTWIDEAINNESVTNIRRPIALDLNADWPVKPQSIDSIFTANTLHIISWPLVKAFFDGITTYLQDKGTLCIYGPFNYNGQFTSDSNASFDIWLKDRSIDSGIRNFEDIVELAQSAKLTLLQDYEMPANNRLLIFKKDD